MDKTKIWEGKEKVDLRCEIIQLKQTIKLYHFLFWFMAIAIIILAFQK